MLTYEQQTEKLLSKRQAVLDRIESDKAEIEKINGKNEKIYVPFVMLTGMMLDNEKAVNNTVSNGKVVNDGTHTFVVGFALPGMQETLQLKSDDLDIPSTVEITADVKDFELSTTLTIATNDAFGDIDFSEVDSSIYMMRQLYYRLFLLNHPQLHPYILRDLLILNL